LSIVRRPGPPQKCVCCAACRVKYSVSNNHLVIITIIAQTQRHSTDMRIPGCSQINSLGLAKQVRGATPTALCTLRRARQEAIGDVIQRRHCGILITTRRSERCNRGKGQVQTSPHREIYDLFPLVASGQRPCGRWRSSGLPVGQNSGCVEQVCGLLVASKFVLD
jgi:hypothetical protein